MAFPPHDPTHYLYHHRCPHTTRTTILCPQGKTKQRNELLRLCSPLPCEMRHDAGDPDQQYEGRRRHRHQGHRYNGHRHRRKKRKHARHIALTGMTTTWDSQHSPSQGTFDSMHKP